MTQPVRMLSEGRLAHANIAWTVLSVAVQAETAAGDNDAIKQDPAVDDAPQIKRAKVEGDEKTGVGVLCRKGIFVLKYRP